MNKIHPPQRNAAVAGGARGNRRAIAERFPGAGAKAEIGRRNEALGRRAAAELQPRGGFVNVKETAASVTWLASAESCFTTAAVFDISGGRKTC